MEFLLLFLQNLCEGHFTWMKDYLRKQYDNTKSVNLVKEVALFGSELERSINLNMSLGIQLFRTLTEFCSGCPRNQVNPSILYISVFIYISPLIISLDYLPNYLHLTLTYSLYIS